VLEDEQEEEEEGRRGGRAGKTGGGLNHDKNDLRGRQAGRETRSTGRVES